MVGPGFEGIRQRLESAGTCTAVLLGVVFAACLPAFGWRNGVLQEMALNPGRTLPKTPDGSSWYSSAELADFYGSLTSDGRAFYASSELTLDVVFPVAYAFLLAVLILCVWRGWDIGLLWALPLAAGLVDLLENLSTASLAVAYDGSATSLALVPAVFTFSKYTLFCGSCLLLGGVWRLKRSVITVLSGLAWVGIVGWGVSQFPIPTSLAAILLLAYAVSRCGVQSSVVGAPHPHK